MGKVKEKLTENKTKGRELRVLCPECKRIQPHLVVVSADLEISEDFSDDFGLASEVNFQVIQCRCGNLSFRHLNWFSEYQDHRIEGCRERAELISLNLGAVMDLKYISNELTHWTGRGKTDDEAIEVLKLILEGTLLRLSKCSTGPKDDKKFENSTSDYMVCFTDVPLNLSNNHCETFGRMGISFKKSSMIRYGANPVFYYMSHLGGSISTFTDGVFDKLTKLLKSNDEEVDVTEYAALRRLLSFVQTYDYHEDDYSDNPNYYQREWRVVFDGSNIVEALSKIKPGQQFLDSINDYVYLCFDYRDVESIIVPEKFMEEAVNLIKGKGSINLKAYEKL